MPLPGVSLDRSSLDRADIREFRMLVGYSISNWSLRADTRDREHGEIVTSELLKSCALTFLSTASSFARVNEAPRTFCQSNMLELVRVFVMANRQMRIALKVFSLHYGPKGHKKILRLVPSRLSLAGRREGGMGGREERGKNKRK